MCTVLYGKILLANAFSFQCALGIAFHILTCCGRCKWVVTSILKFYVGPDLNPNIVIATVW